MASGGTFSGAEEEREETDRIRKLLFEDFTMFLLDNILMSVQFFENYEREVSKFRETCLEETNVDSGQFKIFSADAIHELISAKVMYQRKSPGKKEPPEMLHPLRTYVTYQNVELANNASSLGAKRVHTNPYYRLVVQRCQDDRKEASGYVNVIEPAFAEEKSDGHVGTLIHHPFDEGGDDGEEPKKKPIQSDMLVSKNDTFYVLEPGRRSKPYPLREYRTGERITQSSSIPKSCFKEHERQLLNNPRRRAGVLSGKYQKGKITQKILISAAFKRHFSEVFASHLAGQLGLDKGRLDSATFHLDRIVVRKQHAVYNFIPLLEAEWPYAITTELFNEGKTNNATGLRWPTKTMQRTIQKLGCSLVPVGYHEPSEENTDYTLEWKIEFPKAEEYLTVHMMHTHIRCYLFVLTLYKTFIGTDEAVPHFGPSHILNLLFLMMRRNFLAWPEYSQGETLTRFLRILARTLQKKCLRSFFLGNRNLYHSSPERILHKAQTIIMRILQNPIPYVLRALSNLKYKDDFYPELDYLRLYNILTVKDLSEYLYPKPPKNVNRKRLAQPKPCNLGRDTIDEEELMKEKNTPLHREEVLRLFIEHFINVANQSRKYQSYDYSMLYLVHARRLTMILSEESATRGEIQDFIERINNGIVHCTKAGTKSVHPIKDITNRAAERNPAINRKALREDDQENGTRL